MFDNVVLYITDAADPETASQAQTVTVFALSRDSNQQSE